MQEIQWRRKLTSPTPAVWKEMSFYVSEKECVWYGCVCVCVPIHVCTKCMGMEASWKPRNSKVLFLNVFSHSQKSMRSPLECSLPFLLAYLQSFTPLSLTWPQRA